MAYSCGYWTSDGPGYGLADAQRDKLDLVADKLRLGPGVSLLDMGCGWGSLTVHAAQHRQARVSSVTLSAEQGGYTRERLRGLGLADRARGADPGLPGYGGRPVRRDRLPRDGRARGRRRLPGLLRGAAPTSCAPAAGC